MKTILYKIPSSEIPAILNQLGEAYYWRRSNSKLLYWSNGQWQKTEYDAGDDPLSTLPKLPITGTVLLEGIFDQGLTPKIADQIIDATFQGVDQQWVLNMPKGNISSDLAPFVEQKAWRLPTSAEITEYLKAKGIYSERLFRGCLGLYQGELEEVLGSGDAPELAVAEYKKRKLWSRGIIEISQPDCKVVDSEQITDIIETVGSLLLPEAELAGLPFPKGMIVMVPPGSSRSLVVKSTAARLGIPLIPADWSSLISLEVGQTAENFRQLIEAAEEAAPCILFWNDFDEAFASADLNQENAAGRRLARCLLAWIENLTAPVFCVVTCDRTTQLPPEFKRRFEWQVFVGLPHY
jgi:ATPase family associated with various cellular activities (AAA)